MKWNIGEPGGPNGPFYSIVSETGRIVALQIPDKATAQMIVGLLSEKEDQERRYESAITALYNIHKEMVNYRHDFEGEPTASYWQVLEQAERLLESIEVKDLIKKKQKSGKQTITATVVIFTDDFTHEEASMSLDTFYDELSQQIDEHYEEKDQV